MPKRYQDELDETLEFLARNDRRRLYAEFQEKVKTSLAEFATRNFDSSYRTVVSRAEADPHNPIKSPEKIALKLFKWRKGPKSNPDARISEIHDIAGVSVVLGFPSEVREFTHQLGKAPDLPFEIRKTDLKDPLDRRNLGYSATHLVVRGRGVFHSLLCEVQIKTVLMEAWGKKTHDLTYKPSGEIKSAHASQMRHLTQMIQLLDEQSALLKEAIEAELVLDRAKRITASATLFSKIDQSKIHADLLSSLFVAERHFRCAEPLDLELEGKLINQVNEAISANGHDRDLCRIAVLIALFRPRGERNSWAMSIVDDWIDSLGEAGRLRGAVFRSLANVAIGEFEEAVEDARVVVAIEAKAVPANPPALWSAKMNLAYMLAEASYNNVYVHATGGGDIDISDNEKARLEALAIVREFMSSEHYATASAAKVDTCAATLIQCGSDEETVKEGLKLCASASTAGGTPADQVSKFQELTEKRAYRRLHEISAPAASF